MNTCFNTCYVAKCKIISDTRENVRPSCFVHRNFMSVVIRCTYIDSIVTIPALSALSLSLSLHHTDFILLLLLWSLILRISQLSPVLLSQRTQYFKKTYISQARSSLVANVTRYRRCYAYESSSLIGSLQRFRCIFRYLCWVWSSFIGFFFNDDRLNLSDHVSWFVNRDMQRLTSPFVAHRRELAYFPPLRWTRPKIFYLGVNKSFFLVERFRATNFNSWFCDFLSFSYFFVWFATKFISDLQFPLKRRIWGNTYQFLEHARLCEYVATMYAISTNREANTQQILLQYANHLWWFISWIDTFFFFFWMK